MELAAGDWLIGSDVLCDILLNDTAPHQAILRVQDDDTVIVLNASHETSHDASNFLQGEVVALQGSVVTPYACLSFGHGNILIHAAIAQGSYSTHDAAQWATVTIPTLHMLEMLDQEAAQGASLVASGGQAAGQNNVQSNESADLHGKSSDAPLPSMAPQHGQSQHSPQQNLKAEKGSKVRKILTRTLLLLLLLALCVGGIWNLNAPSEAERQQQDIEAVLRTHKASSLRVMADEQGAWSVSGGVSNGSERKILEEALKGLPFTVNTRIVSIADVAHNIEARIAAEGARLRVRTMHEGLRLFGYIYDEKALDNLLVSLLEDIQYISLQRDVAYYANIQESLQESLRNLGLQHMVALSPGEYGIVLQTQGLTAEHLADLRLFVQEATDMTRGISPFIVTKEKVEKTPTPSQKPDVPVPEILVPAVSVEEDVDFCTQLGIGGEGGHMYVIYQDVRYARGSHLPNGLSVQDVRDSYVTFTQGDRLVYCSR